MSCSLQCGLSDTCLGINYNNETSSCDLVADTSTPPVETLGWNAYTQSTPIKIYLRPCLANASCSNEGCSDTQCNCLSTYKYNWRSGQCVTGVYDGWFISLTVSSFRDILTECTRGYGTTFIEFKDGTFNAPSNFDISGVSVNECAEFCLNTTISPPCEGFSYGSSNGLCRLKERVPTTDGDYFLGTGLFHYMRNCF
ncbi:hypothetical protein ACF0H5_017205 [Mactra antiquata]